MLSNLHLPRPGPKREGHSESLTGKEIWKYHRFGSFGGWGLQGRLSKWPVQTLGYSESKARPQTSNPRMIWVGGDLKDYLVPTAPAMGRELCNMIRLLRAHPAWSWWRNSLWRGRAKAAPTLCVPFLLPCPLHTTFCQPSPALQLPFSVLCSPPSTWAQGGAPSLQGHLHSTHVGPPSAASQWPSLQEGFVCTSPGGSNLGYFALLWNMDAPPVHR